MPKKSTKTAQNKTAISIFGNVLEELFSPHSDKALLNYSELKLLNLDELKLINFDELKLLDSKQLNLIHFPALYLFFQYVGAYTVFAMFFAIGALYLAPNTVNQTSQGNIAIAGSTLGSSTSGLGQPVYIPTLRDDIARAERNLAFLASYIDEQRDEVAASRKIESENLSRTRSHARAERMENYRSNPEVNTIQASAATNTSTREMSPTFASLNEPLVQDEISAMPAMKEPRVMGISVEASSVNSCSFSVEYMDTTSSGFAKSEMYASGSRLSFEGNRDLKVCVNYPNGLTSSWILEGGLADSFSRTGSNCVTSDELRNVQNVSANIISEDGSVVAGCNLSLSRAEYIAVGY